MGILIDSLEKWLREVLSDAVRSNLSKLTSLVNEKVEEITEEVSSSPANWNSGIYQMIRTLSENVIMPLAGLILALVMTVELISLVVEKNNMHDFDTFVFFRWILKTAAAVLIVSNTWNIILSVFEIAGNAVTAASGYVTAGALADNISSLEAEIEAMGTGELISVWLETAIASLMMNILALLVFVISYARMIEIYLLTSLAPLPLASLFESERHFDMGPNYLKTVAALAFQGFLIIVCVGIYSTLIGGIGSSGDISGTVWTSLGYSILLCFALFETGNLSKAIFNAR